VRRLGLLRHLPTDWNREKRLQGRTDRPLADPLTSERFPLDPTVWRLVASPLRRASDTARLLFGAEPETVPELTEMDWGSFEGRRLSDLRRELGDALACNEAQGLDFRPDGGESPRDVQVRLQGWLVKAAQSPRDIIAVTHKGVMRAAHALATGWDMTADAPEEIDYRLLQIYGLGPGGTLSILKLNAGPEDLR
jgi:probable phosphoglycerate mutase